MQTKDQTKDQYLDLVASWQNSPIAYIESIWGLVPQPLTCDEEHTHKLKCYAEFQKGRHITWQQVAILKGIEASLRGEAPRRISVASGHNIGKDALLAWVIHWFLTTRENSQLGCTAPTTGQIYDILWKEIEVWHQKMPDGLKKIFEWSTTHYRVKEKPQTWWARARVAKREEPEAFAGLHADHLMLMGDEASGIPTEIFKVAEGSLTNKEAFIILVSNPRRSEGFFYDTHHSDKKNWQVFNFDSRESPLVDPSYSERIVGKYGDDSDEFRYMVQGIFPKEKGIIEGNWVPLFIESDLKYVPDLGGFTKPKMGIDPAGAGDNKTAHIIRDAFKAKIVGLESKSNPKGIAERSITLASHYRVEIGNINYDNFGQGANLGTEIALATQERPRGVNVGDRPNDPDRFLNKRSELYWKGKEWFAKGGQLVQHEGWKQLLTIYYKRNLSGKIQIMPKDEMLKRGWESPDCADAWAISFEGDRSVSYSSSRTGSYTPSEVARITGIY